MFFLLALVFCTSCHNKTNKDTAKEEILRTEKEFEKMVQEKGPAEACYYYADEKAVILRENNSLITGKDSIRSYYEKRDKDLTVSWTADFVEVSECGTLGYTYGRFTWKKNNNVVFEGIYHTVWEKQRDNSWRYIWD